MGLLGLAFSRPVEYDAGVVAVYRRVIFRKHFKRPADTDDTNLYGAFYYQLFMWYYTLWLTTFFKTSALCPNTILSGLPRLYFAAVKQLGFFNLQKMAAVCQLLFTRLATALIVPYFKRLSQKGCRTVITLAKNPLSPTPD